MSKTPTEFKKQCPVCGKDQYYNNKYNYQKAIKNNKLCISCTTKKMLLTRRQTMLDRYGVENYAQSEECQNKMKQTCIDRYGVEYYSQTQEYKNKYKHTCLEKYGVDSYTQTQECKKKMVCTILDRYGVENYTQTDEYKEKCKITCNSKYGVDNPFQNQEIQNKYKQTCKNKYGVENYAQTEECKEKIKQTCLTKYGVDNPFQNQEIQNKYKQTCLTKYGVEKYAQSEECQNKMKQTCIDRYGVEYHLQSKESKAKIKQTMLNNGKIYTDEYFLSKIKTTKPETNITDVTRIEEKTWEFTHPIHGKWKKKCTSGINSVKPHKIDQFVNKLNSKFKIQQLENNKYEIINLELNALPFITSQLTQTDEFDQHFYPEKKISKLLKKLTYNYQSSKYSFDIKEIESKYSCKFNIFQEFIEYKFVEYYGHSIHECTKQEYESLQLDHSIPQQFFKKYFPFNWELLSNHYTNVKYLKNLNQENQKKCNKYFFNIENVIKWYSEGNIIFPEHLYDFEEERKIIYVNIYG